MALFCSMIPSIKHYLRWRLRRATQKKWKIIISKLRLSKLTTPMRDEITSMWNGTLASEDLYQIAALQQLSKNPSPLFVPEFQYYYNIEPTLNRRSFALAYSDKNFYERFISFPKGLFVRTVIRSMNGVLMNHDYAAIQDADAVASLETGVEYIFKPSTSTSGGDDVALISKDQDGKIRFKERLFDTWMEAINASGLKHGNYLVQERVQQHEWFAKWNPSSLNTVRLMTYRCVDTNQVHHLGSVIRFGRPGSLVDNQAAGGLTCGIDENGFSRSFVCDKYGHVDHEGCFGERVPMHHRMIEIAQELASQFPYHRILGFDFCVNQNGQVQLLEVNCKNIEVNFMQMNNGPLFQDHLARIIAFTNTNRKQHLFEFHY